MTERKNLEAYP